MSEIHIQIGEILKNARIKKNISLEKVSFKTKISIQNLNNIENGKIHLFAGVFYYKSFIQSYLKVLRISDKKILSLLKQNDIKSDVYSEKKPEEIKTSIFAQKLPTFSLLIAGFVGLICFVAINFFIDFDSDNPQLAQIEPKPKASYSIIENNNIIDEIENLKQDAPIKQTRLDIDSLEQNSYNNPTFSLKQIIAKQDVWIEIKDNNENILISTVLKKNESFGLPNNNEVVISASNAGALYFKNGDEKFSKLGSIGAILDSVNLKTLITDH
tara:strand:+ start:394 stop:1206 length:813 start_codon:yes stop_codon:yes gene_type:complete